MSMLPTAKITFEKGLSQEEKEQVCEKIGSLSGVFAPRALPGKDETYATMNGGAEVLREIKKIDGVKRAKFGNLL